MIFKAIKFLWGLMFLGITIGIFLMACVAPFLEFITE